MCNLMTVSVRRTTATIGAIPAVVVPHLLRSRADRCPPKIQRGHGYPRRGGAPDEGITDVDGAGADYILRSSCGVGDPVRGGHLYSFVIAAGAQSDD